MKTIFLFLLSILLLASLPCFAAINYNITFTGTGASTTVDDVVVQNLTKGTTVTVPAGNVLNLSNGLSAVEKLNANNENIRIYPSPLEGGATLSFFSKQAGSTQINVYGLDGRKLVSFNQNLQAETNSFQLSLPKGSFAIQVIGNEYTYSAKMINQSASLSQPKITYTGAEKTLSSAPQKSKNYVNSTTTMTYDAGDRLLYTGTSGNYSTVVTDVPISDKTINFDFAACSDADGNNYKIVKIGTQIWMAENLKTTKFNDGTTIPNVTDGKAWFGLTTPAYCWYYNDANTYKNVYGALYNWNTVNTAKLSPTGWHVPTDAEWTTLENYLLANGFNYDGTTSDNKYAKSLASTSHWTFYWPNSPTTGDVVYGIKENNRTGFSALPGGSLDSSFGACGYLNGSGYWWSATEGSTIGAWARGIYCASSSVSRYVYYKSDGFSVRCIKD